MPRPFIGSHAPVESVAPTRLAPTSPAALEARLREARSPGYLAALARVDTGATAEELIEAARVEFSEIPNDARTAGVVARCALGADYDVHVLDLAQGTAEHYRTGQRMPGELEKARALGTHGDYAFVEVYDGVARAVRRDGSVTVAKLR